MKSHSRSKQLFELALKLLCNVENVVCARHYNSHFTKIQSHTGEKEEREVTEACLPSFRSLTFVASLLILIFVYVKIRNEKLLLARKKKSK